MALKTAAMMTPASLIRRISSGDFRRTALLLMTLLQLPAGTGREQLRLRGRDYASAARAASGFSLSLVLSVSPADARIFASTSWARAGLSVLA